MESVRVATQQLYLSFWFRVCKSDRDGDLNLFCISSTIIHINYVISIFIGLVVIIIVADKIDVEIISTIQVIHKYFPRNFFISSNLDFIYTSLD